MQFKINKTIIEHLINKDERFNRLVNDLGAIELSESNDVFQSLVKSVIFQQLNGKAARTIYHRFLGLYQTIPSPKDVLSTESKILRDVGLSNRKCEYVRGISLFFYNNPLTTNDFRKLDESEVASILLKIRGIGQWTVDMFLIFTLNHLDVLPMSDLGIKKGCAKLCKLNSLPSDGFLLEQAKKWIPYRSVAALYLWKIVDEDFMW